MAAKHPEPVVKKKMDFHRKCKIHGVLWNKDLVKKCPLCDKPSRKEYKQRVAALLK